MYALITTGTVYYLSPGEGITKDRSKAYRYGVREAEDLLYRTNGERMGYRVEVVEEAEDEVVEEEDEVSVLRRRLKALPGEDH